MKIAATVLSVLAAIGFSIVGVTAAIGGDSAFIRVFGFAITAYAVASQTLLVAAWRSRSPELRPIAAVLSAACVIIWTGGSFDNGILSGLEVVGCIVVAMAAGLNWSAVRVITTPPL
jgi:hypothetical protein